MPEYEGPRALYFVSLAGLNFAGEITSSHWTSQQRTKRASSYSHTLFPQKIITALATMSAPKLHVFDSGSELQQSFCDLVAEAAKEATSAHGFFSVGFSGGSVAKMLSQGMSSRADVDWSKWRVFYCDERYVPFDDQDSTHAFFQRELYDKVGIPSDNVFSIDPTLDVDGAAQDYIQKIRRLYPGDGLPEFDLLLLGMGPDGHTCSLFPGHCGLQEKEKLVIPITDSPKPPPSRITLTIPVLNNARCVCVIAAGASKAEAVKACLEPEAGKDPLPAGLVRPNQGNLHWYLDTGSAARLAHK